MAQSYNLKNVRIEIGGTRIFDITKIGIKRKIQYIDRTAGASLTEQTVINKEERPDFDLQGFNGENLKFSQIVAGAPITDFILDEDEPGSDNAAFLGDDFMTMWPLEDAAGNPLWCFGAPETDLAEKDSSEWQVPIICGVLNVGSLADKVRAQA
jgi:hypothetical protein